MRGLVLGKPGAASECPQLRAIGAGQRLVVEGKFNKGTE